MQEILSHENIYFLIPLPLPVLVLQTGKIGLWQLLEIIFMLLVRHHHSKRKGLIKQILQMQPLSLYRVQDGQTAMHVLQMELIYWYMKVQILSGNTQFLVLQSQMRGQSHLQVQEM